MSANMTDDIGDRFAHRLAQPEKEWVGLTDAEVEKVFFDMGQFAKIDLKTFARAIEAKLKEKNT